MPSIVAVHGIAQQMKGPELLRAEWLPALSDGLHLAGHTLDPAAVAFAFYGALFRGPEKTRSINDAPAAGSVADADFDAALLASLWQGAAAAHPGSIFAPDMTTRGTPQAVQAALRAMSRLPFFSGMTTPLMAGNLSQVRRYLREPDIRTAAQDSIHAVMAADCRVIVAHSLGSVVAYEALHRFADDPRWAQVGTLVTLGSPLGIRHLIFDALQPAPENGHGRWPRLLQRWINISDDGDVVALDKKLGNLFGERVQDIGIDNGASAHSIAPYLTAAATGRAIASGASGLG
jgi:hypothetical protein